MELCLRNNLSEIPRLAAAVAAFCTTEQLSIDTQQALDLALEEWLVNIVHYGFTDAAEHRILMRFSRQMSSVDIEIRDDGLPFNPLATPAPTLDADLEQRPIGGLGLYLISAIMDTVNYHRDGNYNVLNLTKQLDSR